MRAWEISLWTLMNMLKNIEMSAQEAAWYLLRQPMSVTSRQVVVIPTLWPHERYRARKRRKLMDDENLSASSTDIWTRSIVEKYEQRHSSLDSICLAHYAAWYSTERLCQELYQCENDKVESDTDENNFGPIPLKRAKAKVIRYRNYDKTDILNHKREMVMLFVPFRNEAVDILDRDKFLQIFEEKKRRNLE